MSSQVVRKKSQQRVPTATGKFNLRLFKRGLLMLVRAKCKTNFTTKIYFNRKFKVLVCTAVAYREKVFCS